MNHWAWHPPILGYHRVGPFRGDHVPTVLPDVFERQLAFLTRRRLRVLGLAELVQELDGGRRPRRSVVITFDDGYEETATVAWPLLRRFGFPAVLFVTPAEVGRAGFATWDQLAALATGGLEIGSHTMHHRYLPLVDPAQLEEEIVGSKRLIEERVGRPVRFLSYPVGGFTPEIQALLRRAGYLAACTTNRATSRLNRIDRFALRRIKMTDRDRHPALLLAKCSGYYDLFRDLKRPA
jgi:peptidoglycan/xylan/chitin deacetylase (PgdA/CDA1 family)